MTSIEEEMKHDFLDQENDFFFIQQVTLQVHAM